MHGDIQYMPRRNPPNRSAHSMQNDSIEKLLITEKYLEKLYCQKLSLAFPVAESPVLHAAPALGIMAALISSKLS